MGAGASAGIKFATERATPEDLDGLMSEFDDATCEKLLGALRKKKDNQVAAAAPAKNMAFVFIKPHAVTDQVKALVKEKLATAGITVTSEGSIAAEVIDKKQLIDTHYGAIAAKAMKMAPTDHVVSPQIQTEFQKVFGVDWKETLDKGLVFNASEAAKKLEIDFDALGAKWLGLKKGEALLKFGGGFYVGKVDDIFVINGFYMDMRKAFTTPGTCIHYYATEWSPEALSWADFREKVLGGTHPKEAANGSVRNTIYQTWEALGLKSEPNMSTNGVHASASPFEGMCERINWLETALADDPFNKGLVAAGLSEETIKHYMGDPAVMYEGKSSSLYDLLEDLDSRVCIEKAAKIAAAAPP